MFTHKTSLADKLQADGPDYTIKSVLKILCHWLRSDSRDYNLYDVVTGANPFQIKFSSVKWFISPGNMRQTVCFFQLPLYSFYLQEEVLKNLHQWWHHEL